ncbi:MAG: glycoside hydrolase family 88 protein, partial [Opitutaceae bacterium]
PEGLAALHAANGDPALPAIGHAYMDALRRRFEQPDGLWARRYDFSPARTVPNQRHTRGDGWAMEGLIASYELTKDAKYRDLAVKMAAHLLAAQHSDGSWSYAFDQPAAAVGLSEKGTALWSLLFYRLHALTRDPAHLRAARRALTWCLENQYTGPDREGHGGIIGITFQSGVTYRAWFPLACSYTSAFFGLAALEELKFLSAPKN